MGRSMLAAMLLLYALWPLQGCSSSSFAGSGEPTQDVPSSGPRAKTQEAAGEELGQKGESVRRTSNAKKRKPEVPEPEPAEFEPEKKPQVQNTPPLPQVQPMKPQPSNTPPPQAIVLVPAPSAPPSSPKPAPEQSKKPANNPTVVTRGSFTAWAEPPNPALGQDYNIVIEIQLPSNVSNYSLEDLSGTLVGTDGFHQTIGPRPERWDQGFPREPAPPQPLEVANGYARVRVFVPGAWIPLTRDTVTLSSQLLREQQTLTIQFSP